MARIPHYEIDPYQNMGYFEDSLGRYRGMSTEGMQASAPVPVQDTAPLYNQQGNMEASRLLELMERFKDRPAIFASLQRQYDDVMKPQYTRGNVPADYVDPEAQRFQAEQAYLNSAPMRQQPVAAPARPSAPYVPAAPAVPQSAGWEDENGRWHPNGPAAKATPAAPKEEPKVTPQYYDDETFYYEGPKADDAPKKQLRAEAPQKQGYNRLSLNVANQPTRGNIQIPYIQDNYQSNFSVSDDSPIPTASAANKGYKKINDRRQGGPTINWNQNYAPAASGDVPTYNPSEEEEMLNWARSWSWNYADRQKKQQWLKDNGYI